MTTPTLQAAALEVSFVDRDGSKRTLLEEFSLSAGPGTFVCVAGRSGSGKTSLLRCLVGLQTPTSGTVCWDGVAISDMDGSEQADLRRVRLAYVDQAAAMVDDLTIADNVVLPAVPDGRRAVLGASQRATEIVSRLGLSNMLHARPSRLSGGERQRAAIARALATVDTTVIADEPTASLDRAWADRVIGELRRLADGGRSIIVASHDPGVAANADFVVQLRG